MTVIVAIRDAGNRTITLGSDQQTTDNAEVFSTDNGSKWVCFNGVWVGVSGPTRVLNVFEAELEQVVGRGGDVHGIPDRLAEQLRARGHDLAHGREYPSLGVSMLIVNENGLWEVSSDLAITWNAPFWAVGSGRMIALGTMKALFDNGEDDLVHIVRMAVKNACHYLADCGGEPWVKQVEF
jgi:ATP-dependent protease HslVU (ClpYQ) peptidase subunit